MSQLAILVSIAVPGPTTQRYTERLAGNMLRLARAQRGWSQRQLAEAAGVPVSTVARIESGARQPSLVTVSRLLAAADLELRARLEPYDDHDDVLDEDLAEIKALKSQVRDLTEANEMAVSDHAVPGRASSATADS